MTDEILPLIGVIAKLDLKPTDIVVVKSRGPISHMTAMRIDRHVKTTLERIGIQNQVLVLDDLDIQVISPSEQGASA